MPAPPTIALLFTTFPKQTETFLQREVVALQAKGLRLQLYSLWGGGGDFNGLPVHTFPKWRLVPLFLFIIPWNFLRRPRIIRDLFAGVFSRCPPSWLNFWENMLGAGFAGCYYHEFGQNPPALVHGAWAGAPATAGWLLWRILDLPYSTGAHAYDLYEHGGDWWLEEKLAMARFVNTSTEMGRQLMIARGADPGKIVCIRRGLETFPACKSLRAPRTPLRLVCIARLVAKKGLDHQLQVYAALRAAGISFEARILGDGPLRAELDQNSRELGLADAVKFLGHQPQDEAWRQLEWADVLLHTGVVAKSGDRDGLPNVIPEAMSAGVLVVTTPTSATTEAIAHEQTGLVCEVGAPTEWVRALRRLAEDDALAERLRVAARRWAEENYDAHKNMARLHELFNNVLAP